MAQVQAGFIKENWKNDFKIGCVEVFECFVILLDSSGLTCQFRSAFLGR